MSGLAASPPPRAGELVASIYGRVYNLALRMLLVPEDAEDAAQDIAVKILRGLPGFRGESKFETWALAIASNHLLSVKARRIPGLSFEAYEAEVGAHQGKGSSYDELSEGERRILEEELKVSCTLGMLQCLDPTDRLVYILHSFFGLSSEEGGEASGLSPEAYRQRLSRTRRKMAGFMSRVCGLVPAEGGGERPCDCAARLGYALERRRLSPEAPYYAASRRGSEASLRLRPGRVEEAIETMENLEAEGALFKAQGPMLPRDLGLKIERILKAEAKSVLQD